MSSILTNTSAMSAVTALTATQGALASTETQISTGLRISSASDNSAYWSISTSMRSDISAYGAVNDSINLGLSVVGVAYAAVSASISVLNEMKNLVVDAQSAGQNTTLIDAQLALLQQQLRTFSNRASFNGVNLLATSQTTQENIVASFSKNQSGIDTIGLVPISLDTPLYSTPNGTVGDTGTGILDAVDSNTGYSVDNMVTSSAGNGAAPYVLIAAEQNQIETAITALTTAASKIGSTQTNLATQGTAAQSMISLVSSEVGSLVDTDMNKVSSRMNALQTQQQLGIQALGIANQNSQIILKLFQ